MWGVEIVFELLDVCEFKAEVTGEVVSFQFEGDLGHKLFFVDFDADLEVKPVDELVGDVFFG